jgi:hypothetical protein
MAANTGRDVGISSSTSTPVTRDIHQYFVHLVAELPDLSELPSTLVSNLDHIGRDGCSVGCLQFGPQLVISDFNITPGPSEYDLWQHQNHN